MVDAYPPAWHGAAAPRAGDDVVKPIPRIAVAVADTACAATEVAPRRGPVDSRLGMSSLPPARRATEVRAQLGRRVPEAAGG
jgi:hypothetical protein